MNPHRSWGLLLLCILVTPAVAGGRTLYLGADLSYVNELEDCGGRIRENGAVKDPFELFHEHGANMIRVRLWNNATWTHYSNLDDVRKTIRRTRAAGMQSLLDFHYSDDWADGGKQIIPAAWANITDTDALAEALYRFTFDTLAALDHDGLMPQWVQVGNETNGEILGQADWGEHRPINWERNGKLFKAGIRAVRDAGAKSSMQPRVMLHIAQPENVLPWFAAATQAGVTDCDLIGISYYAKWSKYSIAGLGTVIKQLRARYKADVIVVETAYPWTLESADSMNNILGEDSLIPGYPATPDGQKRYLIDLTQTVIDSGGIGTIYWEPAWISTQCRTRWGQGSSWENAALFSFRRHDEPLPGIEFLRHSYRQPEP
ncbi:MAG: glycoside hydrolase family 53 protein [Steroidobacterales bacterium]